MPSGVVADGSGEDESPGAHEAVSRIIANDIDAIGSSDSTGQRRGDGWNSERESKPCKDEAGERAQPQAGT